MLTDSDPADSTRPPNPSSPLTRPIWKLLKACLPTVAGKELPPPALLPSTWDGWLKLKPGEDSWERIDCVVVWTPLGAVLVTVGPNTISLVTLRSNSRSSWKPSSTPNSSVLLSSTSTINAWTVTCSAGRSSASIIFMISSKYRGVALMIREFVWGSPTTITSRSICSNGLTRSGSICCRSRCDCRKALTALAISMAGLFLIG